MSDNIDWYRKQLIDKGNEVSDISEEIASMTLKNSPLVDVIKQGISGIKIVRVPGDKLAVVHSSTGVPKYLGVKRHVSSMVKRLLNQAAVFGSEPVAFANIIDYNDFNVATANKIMRSMKKVADLNNIVIINGESAGLGERVNTLANASGTMLSTVPKSRYPNLTEPLLITAFGNSYIVFDPEEKPIFMNVDGVGTKTEFYERIGKYELAVKDLLAMVCDDAIKVGAEIKAISGTLEYSGNIPINKIKKRLTDIISGWNIQGSLYTENVQNRIRGYESSTRTYNLNACAVSVIDEDKLNNLPTPNVRDWLIALRKIEPNPRSNGITDKRKFMIEKFGNNYHNTEMGRHYLEYLAEPSAIFYPFFKEVLDSKLVSSVYHMSGGAFDGKLAKPLAKHNLFAGIDKNRLFLPDPREIQIMMGTDTSVRDAYAKWSMGNEGFVTTNMYNMRAVKELAQKYGFETLSIGFLTNAIGGKTGIEFTAFDGEKIHFNGKG